LFWVVHSNHLADGFADLLKNHDVEVLVDMRSHSYSHDAPQFHTVALKALLATAGVNYLYLGRELGGRPQGADYYDSRAASCTRVWPRHPYSWRASIGFRRERSRTVSPSCAPKRIH
jgi:hypothetical protein